MSVIDNHDSEARGDVLTVIEPQPPRGIKYMLGGESWLTKEKQSPFRLHCEEWGNLGPLNLDAEIEPNEAGFRVRITTIPAPPGAKGYTEIAGVYYWTKSSCYERYTREQ